MERLMASPKKKPGLQPALSLPTGAGWQQPAQPLHRMMALEDHLTAALREAMREALQAGASPPEVVAALILAYGSHSEMFPPEVMDQAFALANEYAGLFAEAPRA